jgi:hypothetical protein
VRGISQRLAVEFSPVLDAISESLINAATEAGGFGEAVSRAFDFIIKSTGFVINAVAGIGRTFELVGKSIAATMAGAVGATDKLMLKIEELTTRAVFAIAGLDPTERLAELAAQGEASTRAFDEAVADLLATLARPLPGAAFESFINQAREATVETKRLAQTFSDELIDDDIDEMSQALEDFERVALRAFGQTRTATEKAVEAFAEFSNAVDQIGVERLTEMGINVEQVFDRLRDNVKTSMQGLENDSLKASSASEQFFIQAARNIQDSMAQFIFDPFRDGVRGMLKGFVDALRQMVAQIAASKILSLLGGLGGPVGSFFSMGLPSRDSGGRGVAGQPYMIGRGAQPEIFIPDSAGTFIPNADQLGNTNFQITVDATDPGAEGRIKSMIEQEMMPQIIEVATGRTIAQMRRPRFA